MIPFLYFSITFLSMNSDEGPLQLLFLMSAKLCNQITPVLYFTRWLKLFHLFQIIYSNIILLSIPCFQFCQTSSVQYLTELLCFHTIKVFNKLAQYNI